MQKNETFELEINTVIFHITPKHSIIEKSKVLQAFELNISKVNQALSSFLSKDDLINDLKLLSSNFENKKSIQNIFNHEIDFPIHNHSAHIQNGLLKYEIITLHKDIDYLQFKKDLKEKLSYKRDNQFIFIQGEILSYEMYQELQKIIQSQQFKSLLILENIINKEINFRKSQDEFPHTVLEDVNLIKQFPSDFKRIFNQKSVFVDNFENHTDKKVKFLHKNYIPWLKTKLISQQFDDKTLCFIGDSHEDLDTLKNLINKIDSQYKNNVLIFIGDYLDKGNQTKSMIDYLYELKEKRHIILIEGNHESFVYRRLTGQVNVLDDEEEIFSSLKTLKHDEITRSKFAELHLSSVPFFQFMHEGQLVIATHAPCHPKNLGKINHEALKNQRNFYFKDRNLETMYQEIKFIQDTKYADVIQIFGHVACSKAFDVNNKYFIDSGSVYGNEMSALIFHDKIDLITEKSVQYKENIISQLFSPQDFIKYPHHVKNIRLCS